MLIDILLGIIALYAIYKGWTRGVILGVFSFLALILGLAAALKLSTEVGLYLEEQSGQPGKFWPAIAFVLLFFGVALLVRLLAAVLKKLMKLVLLGWLNRLAGILFYLLAYAIVFSVILWLADQMQLLPVDMKMNSLAYERIQFLGPRAVENITGWMPWFRDIFEQIEQFFGRLSPL